MTEAQSLTETIFRTIRADILACRLLPGAKLKIAALAQRLDVSLGAVREALSRLSAEGLVVSETQRGFRVAPVSAADLTDLTTTRIEIESLCLRRAIAAQDVAWEAELLAAFHRLAHTPEREPNDAVRLADNWSRMHEAFHLALVSGCKSSWLLRLRGTLYMQSERYRRLSIPVARVDRDLVAEHRAIMDAAIARDAERATALLAEHLSTTARILLTAPELKEDPDSPSGEERGRRVRPQGSAAEKEPASV
jgi:DNA-binding GntR family transcriptional regulator